MPVFTESNHDLKEFGRKLKGGMLFITQKGSKKRKKGYFRHQNLSKRLPTDLAQASDPTRLKASPDWHFLVRLRLARSENLQENTISGIQGKILAVSHLREIPSLTSPIIGCPQAWQSPFGIVWTPCRLTSGLKLIPFPQSDPETRIGTNCARFEAADLVLLLYLPLDFLSFVLLSSFPPLFCLLLLQNINSPPLSSLILSIQIWRNSNYPFQSHKCEEIPQNIGKQTQEWDGQH